MLSREPAQARPIRGRFGAASASDAATSARRCASVERYGTRESIGGAVRPRVPAIDINGIQASCAGRGSPLIETAATPGAVAASRASARGTSTITRAPRSGSVAREAQEVDRVAQALLGDDEQRLARDVAAAPARRPAATRRHETQSPRGAIRIRESRARNRPAATTRARGSNALPRSSGWISIARENAAIASCSALVDVSDRPRLPHATTCCGLMRQHAPIGRDRVVVAIQRCEHEAEVVVEFRFRRTQRRASLDQRQRAGGVAALICDHAEIVQGERMVGSRSEATAR